MEHRVLCEQPAAHSGQPTQDVFFILEDKKTHQMYFSNVLIVCAQPRAPLIESACANACAGLI